MSLHLVLIFRLNIRPFVKARSVLDEVKLKNEETKDVEVGTTHEEAKVNLCL